MMLSKVLAAILSVSSTVLLLADNTAYAQTTEEVTEDPPQVIYDYVCGQGDEDRTYATWDTALVCLFFDSLSPPLKVVYTPQVDKFEVF